jgi:hypothetical protein
MPLKLVIPEKMEILTDFAIFSGKNPFFWNNSF